MPLTAHAELIFAADVKLRDRFVDILLGVIVTPLRFLRQYIEPNTLDLRSCPRKVAIDDVVIESDRLKDLRPLVALHRGDAHLRHHFENAFFNGEHIVGKRLVEGESLG